MNDDEFEALRGAIKEDVAAGVAEGLRRVLQDPEAIAGAMDTVVATAQRRAAEHTGRAFFGLIKSLLSKWLVIAVIVLLVLKLAGVDVAVKVWRLLTGGSP